jgi:hypothetical protein
VLALEARDFSLTMNANFKVITLGTPYLGVENTGVLQVLFHNKQTHDMAVLSKELSRLSWGWKHRFNQMSEAGERETPQIPIHAYYGIEDSFVLQASACGGPVMSCEPVDGDHISMAKPMDREHLAYVKLKGRVLDKMSRIQSTASDKIGVWVAKIDGEEAAQAQQSLVRSLEFYIEQESELSQLVEIRELPARIAGETLIDKKADAVRLGGECNAAILVWGHVTKLLERTEFHPRVTLVDAINLTPRTSVLPAITESHRQEAQLSAPPGTVSLPPEPLKEPLQLTRLVAALSFGKQGKVKKATDQFDALLAGGGMSTVSLTEVSACAAPAYMAAYRETKDCKALIRARDCMPDPLAVGEQYTSTGLFIGAHAFRLVVKCALVDEKLLPAADLQSDVVVLLRDFVPLFKQEDLQKDWLHRSGYMVFLLRVGEVCEKLAEWGVESRENLERAVRASEEASHGLQELEQWDHYARAQEVLGESYLALAKQGVDVDQNFANYLTTLKEIQRISRQLKEWRHGAWAYFKYGALHASLADDCKEHGPQFHLEEACTAYEEVLRIACENDDKVAQDAITPILGTARASLEKVKVPAKSESS